MFCILKGHFHLLLSFHSEIPFKSGLRACMYFFQSTQCENRPRQFSPLCLLWRPCSTWQFRIRMFVKIQGPCLIDHRKVGYPVKCWGGWPGGGVRFTEKLMEERIQLWSQTLASNPGSATDQQGELGQVVHTPHPLHCKMGS